MCGGATAGAARPRRPQHGSRAKESRRRGRHRGARCRARRRYSTPPTGPDGSASAAPVVRRSAAACRARRLVRDACLRPPAARVRSRTAHPRCSRPRSRARRPARRRRRRAAPRRHPAPASPSRRPASRPGVTGARRPLGRDVPAIVGADPPVELPAHRHGRTRPRVIDLRPRSTAEGANQRVRVRSGHRRPCSSGFASRSMSAGTISAALRPS